MANTRSNRAELLNNQAPADRRKGKRLFLNYSVEIKGFDRAGRLFAARVKTEDISESGCRIQTPLHLEPGDVITKLNGAAIDTVKTLKAVITRGAAHWTIAVRRDGKIITARIDG